MVTGGFYALLSRMRYIARWGLMRSSIPENLQEHSHMAAVLAHALGLIRREVFGIPCDADRLAAIALYHDASETLTGDLPTPIKYHDPEIRTAYKKIEALAVDKLENMLPAELQSSYHGYLSPSAEEDFLPLLKAADKLCAYLQCVEERKAGNHEFLSAERQIFASLKEMELPELDYFIEKCLPAFELDLDELGAMDP